jgi:hypothetical protein
MSPTTCSGMSVSRHLLAAVAEGQAHMRRRIVAGKSRRQIQFSVISEILDVPIVRPHVPTCQATVALSFTILSLTCRLIPAQR